MRTPLVPRTQTATPTVSSGTPGATRCGRASGAASRVTGRAPSGVDADGAAAPGARRGHVQHEAAVGALDPAAFDELDSWRRAGPAGLENAQGRDGLHTRPGSIEAPPSRRAPLTRTRSSAPLTSAPTVPSGIRLVSLGIAPHPALPLSSSGAWRRTAGASALRPPAPAVRVSTSPSRHWRRGRWSARRASRCQTVRPRRQPWGERAPWRWLLLAGWNASVLLTFYGGRTGRRRGASGVGVVVPSEPISTRVLLWRGLFWAPGLLLAASC